MKTKLTLGTVTLFALLALLVLNGRSHSQDGNGRVRAVFEAPEARVVYEGPEARAVYGFEATIEVRPLVSQYVELSSQLANRMTEEELQAAIVEMTQELDSRNADDKIQSVRESLQEIIESHPDSPSADAALRALEGLLAEPRIEFIPDEVLPGELRERRSDAAFPTPPR